VPKSKPFTIRLSEEVEGWLERENRRTRLPKSALLEALAEESIRTRRFPGMSLRGASTQGERGRSAQNWMSGSSSTFRACVRSSIRLRSMDHHADHRNRR